uniref:Uncharacterized protein n=1 Tax=Octopus bimaculoides TaxID=37653 RepID=A0A0L8HMB8_OCTBM
MQISNQVIKREMESMAKEVRASILLLYSHMPFYHLTSFYDNLTIYLHASTYKDLHHSLCCTFAKNTEVCQCICVTKPLDSSKLYRQLFETRVHYISHKY